MSSTKANTRRHLIRKYTSGQGTHKKINDFLRKINDTEIDETTQEVLDTIKQNFVEYTPTKPMVLYRGIDNYARYDELIKEEWFQDLGFVSTSTKNKIAKAFNPNSIIEITLVPGQTYKVLDMKNYSAYPEEEEILLYPGYYFYKCQLSNNTKYIKYFLLSELSEAKRICQEYLKHMSPETTRISSIIKTIHEEEKELDESHILDKKQIKNIYKLLSKELNLQFTKSEIKYIISKSAI